MSTPTRWPALSVRITLIDVRSITFLRDIAHIANVSPAYRPSDLRKNYWKRFDVKPEMLTL